MGTIYWPPRKAEDKVIKKGISYTLENSDILTAQIPWYPGRQEFLKDIGWIATLAKDHHRKLIVNMDWMKDDRKSLRHSPWNFQDSTCKRDFINSALEVCKLYNPQYLNLGVEVNFYALTNPQDFRAFVDLYNVTKKRLSYSYPNTKVSVSFQLELLFGIHRNWGKKASLEVFEAFGDNFDILSISTYPNSSGTEPSNLKNLKILLNRSQKPFGIFETSIPSNLYSEEKQKNYLKTLISFLKESERCQTLIWTSTADTENLDNKALWINYLGLFDQNFRPKKALSEWELCYKLKKN
ncbi:glycosyl hydrolase 53 family protein [Desertivirga arenae]|uniref:glycosyl hydrolase 53 family protein n=1 Tax=Desertivirga arenae TaxID=2810309 RepID=UPI001A9612C2|nr:glycosyl hydrolase 53 family protein [Pedobacter sp. SYSU D00823]